MIFLSIYGQSCAWLQKNNEHNRTGMLIVDCFLRLVPTLQEVFTPY